MSSSDESRADTLQVEALNAEISQLMDQVTELTSAKDSARSLADKHELEIRELKTIRDKLSEENKSLQQQLQDALDQELCYLDAMQEDFVALQRRNWELEDQDRRSRATVKRLTFQLESQKVENAELLRARDVVATQTREMVSKLAEGVHHGSDDSGGTDSEIERIRSELAKARTQNCNLAATTRMLFISLRKDYLEVAESMRQCVVEMVRLRNEKRIVRERIGDHPILVFFDKVARWLPPSVSKPN
jgi:chromosome segregation ATPase